MDIKLETPAEGNLHLLYEIRLQAFTPLYERYQDHETSPVKESFERFAQRIRKGDETPYEITYQGKIVGFIRIRFILIPDKPFTYSPLEQKCYFASCEVALLIFMQ